MSESTDLTEPSTMRNVGAKLAEMHPAVLATGQSVAEALVILRKQEHRANLTEEAKRLRDEERWQEDEDRRRDNKRESDEKLQPARVVCSPGLRHRAFKDLHI